MFCFVVVDCFVEEVFAEEPVPPDDFDELTFFDEVEELPVFVVVTVLSDCVEVPALPVEVVEGFVVVVLVDDDEPDEDDDELVFGFLEPELSVFCLFVEVPVLFLVDEEPELWFVVPLCFLVVSTFFDSSFFVSVFLTVSTFLGSATFSVLGASVFFVEVNLRSL